MNPSRSVAKCRERRCVITLPIIGQITQISDQLGRELSTATGSLSQFIPSGWTSGIAILLLLPFFGLVVQPALRLGGALTHSISAIGSALIVCIASFTVLLIQHVTTLVHALRPSPRLEPILRIVVPAGVVMFIAYRAAIPLQYLVGTAALAVFILILLRLDTVQARGFVRKIRGRRSLPVTICAGLVVCAISFAFYSLYRPSASVNSCLVGGHIKQECLAKLNAERF